MFLAALRRQLQVPGLPPRSLSASPALAGSIATATTITATTVALISKALASFGLYIYILHCGTLQNN